METEASKPRRKLAAILMVDVAGFSRMMGRDEEGTTTRIRAFHTRTQALVEAHEGRVVDTAGDSVFGEFDSSHSRRRRMLLKINDLYHSAFVNIKPIESTTYAFTPLEMWPVLN